MNQYTFRFDKLPTNLNKVLNDFYEYETVQDFERLPHYNFFRQLHHLFYNERKIFIESCAIYEHQLAPHLTNFTITLRGKSSFTIEICCNTQTRTIHFMLPHDEAYCQRSLINTLSYAFNYSRPAVSKDQLFLPYEKRIIWSGLVWRK
ncbi:hypothetical protein JMA_29810 [Jeotgalibacillus malaysiensis]|uniref:Uncharacterized protein n=1 Tax=Jeotgalibacillus malaysiensis TaxID=1508404 RepID=A0A0B5AUL6_9BACL|nr:hypothetical protein [Jeotgalibacillus malaysiensis]AJD92298.1 hypothetical protein JMA_29810 [Jeotgalibacillus malaysiensis]